jgi:hypothetical protein
MQVSMKRYCVVRKVNFESDYNGFSILDLLESIKVVFGMLSVLCMCPSLAPEQLKRFYLQILNHPRSQPGECEYSNSKNSNPSDGPQNKIVIFLKAIQLFC